MHILVSESLKRLDDEEWEDYMSCKVEGFTRERRFCREWSAITTAVRNADGITGNVAANSGTIGKDILRVSNRHYIPYMRIQDGFLQNFLRVTGGVPPQDRLTLRAAGQRLEWAIQQLYFTSSGTAFDPRRSFRPPLCHRCHQRVELKKCEHWQWSSVESSRTRAHASNWMTWALEIICDFPDNIYLGHGTGDRGGLSVDVPVGVNANQRDVVRRQSQRVAHGAAKLVNVLSSDFRRDGMPIVGASPFTWNTDLEGRPRHVWERDELADGRIFIDKAMKGANDYAVPPTVKHLQPFLHYFSCKHHGNNPSSQGLEAFYAQWQQMENLVENRWGRPLTIEESKLLVKQLNWFEETYDHMLTAGLALGDEAWNIWRWYLLRVEEPELNALTDREALERFIDESST
ncbi:unnamed protein product [Clonostachys rosea]|uniref:Uncharacterized protein n=1 Tax=Bionectria ochroleuca TaxID=29856 RepID=A0ABY6U825_BIOOC|nr:unnamed protein product [Clonostachys rosea]